MPMSKVMTNQVGLRFFAPRYFLLWVWQVFLPSFPSLTSGLILGKVLGISPLEEFPTGTRQMASMTLTQSIGLFLLTKETRFILCPCSRAVRAMGFNCILSKGQSL